MQTTTLIEAAPVPEQYVDNRPEQHVDNRQIVPISLPVRIGNLLAVTIPFAGVIAAIVLLWGVAFNWIYLAILFGMYLASAVGITVGYHRLFTHSSFKTPRVVAAILAALGSMAVEGPVLQWVAVHRSHHQHSDCESDPHSPHTHGDTFWGMVCGMWHAHMGWLFRINTRDLAKYSRDLRRDPLIRRMSKLFPLWVFLGLLIPAVLGGLFTLSWMGVLLGFIWGGLVRIFLVHHVTWSVNSVCHIWGSHPFNCHDESRNNAIFGVLALGEGWHNNHHADPRSAAQGHRWFEIDLTFRMLRLFARFGWVWDIVLPNTSLLERKKR